MNKLINRSALTNCPRLAVNRHRSVPEQCTVRGAPGVASKPHFKDVFGLLLPAQHSQTEPLMRCYWSLQSGGSQTRESSISPSLLIHRNIPQEVTLKERFLNFFFLINISSIQRESLKWTDTISLIMCMFPCLY